MMDSKKIEKLINEGLSDKWWLSVDGSIIKPYKTLKEIKEFEATSEYKKMHVMHVSETESHKWIRIDENGLIKSSMKKASKLTDRGSIKLITEKRWLTFLIGLVAGIVLILILNQEEEVKCPVCGSKPWDSWSLDNGSTTFVCKKLQHRWNVFLSR